MTPAEQLHAGIAALGLTLSDGAERQLLAYLDLLAKWNRTYNLTAVRKADEMVTHHLLDSLAVLPRLEKSVPAIRRLVDVGSGAGVPGLVLAIVRPELEVASIEASQKKTAFQQQTKIELGLSNVSIHCARSEAINETFDAAISRAFASLADFVRYAGHLSQRLLAMKGQYPADEVAALPAGWRLASSHDLSVPGLDAQRHLLVLEKT
ncbi:16S rRNA (guanine(527)-N(7))-methyltransferase RsmG [Sulfurisoma sediminicola]|uniref:Ribosomal RNA small subunit methyltransferase G n=1 Tax=Sulfurisoma sediminicola TaxID=1381557 RepID=A0A497XLA0_9PROT|nr:16S rRNA (guanine(527)-N(7))-methyltransferase RsmG [Sulfurisoma sediminicola]RLJ68187.1 16S rRNA m(7)G-527 methyltransferase [Sulfurisoma sediminicola]